MKKLNCETENCIPTPSSCTQWNGGDIESLGICNGEWLNTVIIEIVDKIKDLSGTDLSIFDIDELIDICKQKAPLEINLISILTLLRDNQICLKDYIDTLSDKITGLGAANSVTVNLKCYADFDNLGNSLSITRESLDQLVIDQLCNHDQRLTSSEGKLVALKQQLDNFGSSLSVEELSFATAIQTAVLPTSTQVIDNSQELYDIREVLGTAEQILPALGKTPVQSTLNTEFGTITGWNLAPLNWAQNYGNLLLEVEALRKRIVFMETNCCAATCDDIKVGFSVVMNEDQSGIILRFTSGAGTMIPQGFTDSGSSVTITDIDGNTIDAPLAITMGAEAEVIITGLSILGDMNINVTVKMTNGVINCEKCINKTVHLPGCSFCTITATAPVKIIYEVTTL